MGTGTSDYSALLKSSSASAKLECYQHFDWLNISIVTTQNNYVIIEREITFHLTLTKDALCQVFLKFAKWFWRSFKKVLFIIF